MLIPIILGSKVDVEYATQIVNVLNKYNVNSVIRVCSAHKNPTKVLTLISDYDTDIEVPLYITIAGKSNALSALIDGLTDKPVISSPPLTKHTMYDIYSSINMPSGICPLVVLNATNCAVAAIKICAVRDNSLKQIVNDLHMQNKHIINIDDVKNKYKSHCFDNVNVNQPTEYENNIIYNNQNTRVKLHSLIKKGKIRDIYSMSIENNLCNDNSTSNSSASQLSNNIGNNNCSKLCMVATDRLSSFNKVLCNIPYKGEIINKISAWWFDKTKHIVANHIVNDYSLSRKYANASIVKKCTVFPIEFIMRAYMTGNTETSIWMNYSNGSRDYCGHKLRDGYNKNDKLDEIILTPTTKSDVNDELISKEIIIEKGIMTREDYEICEKHAYNLFRFGQEVLLKKGLILVDTKYEFGRDTMGNIILIDELHTPDSSRMWINHNYKERVESGQNPENFDKDGVRRWVRENYKNPYEATSIEVSQEEVQSVSKVYMQLYELITEEGFVHK